MHMCNCAYVYIRILYRYIQAIFLKPFTVCSTFKREFVVCPIFCEEANSSSLFANGLYGLAHVCVHVAVSMWLKKRNGLWFLVAFNWCL